MSEEVNNDKLLEEMDLNTWAMLLDEEILKFNELAKREGEEVIVAFRMPLDEAVEFLNGFFAGVEDADNDEE